MKILEILEKSNKLKNINYDINLRFNKKYINKHNFNSLLNILSNENNLLGYIVNKTYFDDDDNNIYLEEIYTNDEKVMQNYKQDIVIEEHKYDKASLVLNEITSLTDEISEYYYAGLFDETKIIKSHNNVIILENGVQVNLILNENYDIKTKELINEDYEILIEFNYHLINKKKLEYLIDKYRAKILFYLNLQNILKPKISKLFKLKYINELNKILNKPVTLERDDINKLKMYYTITEKADGERHLLIIDKYGVMFLINNKFEIKCISKHPFKHLQNCILDGEFLSISENSDKINKYLIFDILEYNNKSMLNKKFIERLKYLNLAFRELDNKHELLFNKTIEIKIKEFYILKDFIDDIPQFATDIDKGTEIIKYPFLNIIPKNNYKEVLTNLWINRDKKFSYLLDGLIFTPLNGLYIPIDRTYMIYKWKDKHTIDVRVIPDSKKDLIWHFDVNRSSKLSNHDFIKDYVYDESLDNSDIGIAENDIIEFIWNGKQFIPLRIRNDKIKPNARLTVESVINAIKDDIKIDELFEIPNQKLNFGDVYYQERNLNKKERENSSDINLKKFHNYIKTQLILYPTIKESNNRKGYDIVNKNLLDLACGKGGDLKKWIHSDYTNILACDISKTALIEFKNRIKKLKKLIKFDITVVNADSTQDLTSGKAGISDIDKEVLNTFFNDTYKGIKFNKIVCNFAISYMFVDKYASQFFKNIESTLSYDDGYFVGTYIDGELLDKEFIDNKKDEIVAKNDKGEIFYKIKPMDNYSKKSTDNKILVSRPGIGGWSTPIPEPIVYTFQILDAAKKIGLHNIEILNFKDYYSKFKKENSIEMSKGEQKISFLHNVFIISR